MLAHSMRLHAQLAPPLVLGARVAYQRQFSNLISVRELSDGRVLANDGREHQIYVLDAVGKTFELVGREGRGPNEYIWTGQLFALGGDSSLTADLAQRRWLVLSGAKIVRTIPSDHVAIVATSALILGADRNGNVLATIKANVPPGISRTSSADSVAIVSVSRSRGTVDTLARIRQQPKQSTTKVNKDGGVVAFSWFPLGTVFGLELNEAAVMFNSGDIAIVRVEPFRVDHRGSRGEWTPGKPLPIPRIRMDQRQRDGYVSRNREALAEMRVPPPTARDFPEFMPPFVNPTTNVLPTPEGFIFIETLGHTDLQSRLYVVVNAAGNLVGQLILPSSDKVIGFGRNSMYINSTNSDGVMTLSKRAWKTAK